MLKVIQRFLGSIAVPPSLVAVSVAACAGAVGVLAGAERALGHPLDVSWFFTLNLLIVYSLQVLPIIAYGCCAVGRPQAFPPCAARTRFLCVVPAHNEQRVIATSAGSLLAQAYPKELFEVWVVSDGSTDATDAIARDFGATVIRTPTRGLGKHRALAYAFERLLRGPGDDRYVCVVDADNRVDPNFLQEMNNAICAGGYRCLQAFQDVLNGGENWITKALWITTVSSSRLYNEGRSQGLGNALLCGTGWCCEAGLLWRYWPRVQTQTEDIELNGLLLLHEGVGVPSVTAARIYDEKPNNLWTAIRQRHRWMTGHMRTARVLFWPCLRAGIQRRDPRLVELALYYLLPFVMNLGNLQFMLVMGIQLGVMRVHGLVATPAAQLCLTGLTLLYLFGYQVGGFALETRRWWRAPLYSLAAALFSFVAWTPALVWACFSLSRTDWMFHTPHGDVAPQATRTPALASEAAGRFRRRWRRLVPTPALEATAAAVLLTLLPVAGFGSQASVAKIDSITPTPPAAATPEHPPERAARVKAGPAVADAAEQILSGKRAEAVATLEPFVAGDSQDREARGLLAVAYYSGDQRVQGEWEASILRQEDASGTETAFLVARDLLPAFDIRSPVAHAVVELLTPHGGADGFVWLAQIFEARGLYDAATTVLSCGVDLETASPELLAGLAASAWTSRRYRALVGAYWRTIPLTASGSKWRIYLALGRAYLAWGRYRAARAAWATAERLHPDALRPDGLMRQQRAGK